MRAIVRSALVVILAGAAISGPRAAAAPQHLSGPLPQSPVHTMNQSDVRESVTSLGVGKRVVIRFADSSKTTGRILAIEADTFTVRLDGGSPDRTIAYAHVREVSPKMSKRTKTLMFIGIGVGAYAVTALAYWLVGLHCCS